MSASKSNQVYAKLRTRIIGGYEDIGSSSLRWRQSSESRQSLSAK